MQGYCGSMPTSKYGVFYAPHYPCTPAMQRFRIFQSHMSGGQGSVFQSATLRPIHRISSVNPGQCTHQTWGQNGAHSPNSICSSDNSGGSCRQPDGSSGTSGTDISRMLKTANAMEGDSDTHSERDH